MTRSGLSHLKLRSIGPSTKKTSSRTSKKSLAGNRIKLQPDGSNACGSGQKMWAISMPDAIVLF